MTLAELFRMGGIQFMLLITLLAIGMLVFTVKSIVLIYVKNSRSGKGVNYILMFGSLAFIFGILGQAIGMFGAFEAIQQVEDISPGLIAAGIRVSMIAPLYGLMIFIISIPIWAVLRESSK